MVTYLFPLGGVILGILILHEQLTWQIIAGAALIVASLAVSNWEPGKQKTIEHPQVVSKYLE
jgi:drug/metabolite transporter (DMT)-like permease